MRYFDTLRKRTIALAFMILLSYVTACTVLLVGSLFRDDLTKYGIAVIREKFPDNIQPPDFISGQQWIQANICKHATIKPSYVNRVYDSFLGSSATMRANDIDTYVYYSVRYLRLFTVYKFYIDKSLYRSWLIESYRDRSKRMTNELLTIRNASLCGPGNF